MVIDTHTETIRPGILIRKVLRETDSVDRMEVAMEVLSRIPEDQRINFLVTMIVERVSSEIGMNRNQSRAIAKNVDLTSRGGSFEPVPQTFIETDYRPPIADPNIGPAKRRILRYLDEKIPVGGAFYRIGSMTLPQFDIAIAERENIAEKNIRSATELRAIRDYVADNNLSSADEIDAATLQDLLRNPEDN